ncbi:bifunctional 6-phosphofructokinase/tagatose-6-phosphate kinase [Candidatus Sulfopaludibacter sp. SbA3]|nr:bifunctional 6-phosphofructokinase/tagatose-6-phosphate kinase [Candidatus Sulfopaludibacter sp. SbA3]
MIVTLTINPAIDRIISVDRLAFEDRAYINSSRESAGGRGINASCVLHSFGADTTAVFPSGGDSGKRLESLLRDCGFLISVVPIQHSIRTNLTVTDKHGLTVNLNEAGPVLAKAEVARVERAVKERLDHATWLMVSGSVPPGVPSSLYAKLITMARHRNVKTLLHADGQVLREGIEAKPTVVTPNQQEAERLLGRTLLTRTHGLEVAELIRRMGPESVVLSLGSRGAIGAFADGLMEAIPPRVDAVCPIGAGDALAAAYTWSMTRKANPAEALRWGVAAGTASARLPGMNFASLEQAREVYRQVELRRAE